ncbi:autotransporter outer membrane beta-barrel domain-containing protein (plasmid) [Yersinia intermedia]
MSVQRPEAGSYAAKNATYFIQPKAQITWMEVKADNHKEANGTNVSREGDGNIQTRLGVKAFMNGYAAQDFGLYFSTMSLSIIM